MFRQSNTAASTRGLAFAAIQSSTTKSKPSVLPKEVPQPVPLEADVLATQLGKVYFGALATNIEIDSLYRTTTDESARQESQDVAHHSLSFTSCLIDQEASSRGSSYGHIEDVGRSTHQTEYS
jgi:hypothetical protein